MSKLDDIKKEMKDSKMDPESMKEVFQKFNVTPDNPEVMKGIMKDVGLKEDMNVESAEKMVKEMTDNPPPEMKKMLADFVMEMSESVEAPMPEDMKNLLKTWKEGVGKNKKEPRVSGLFLLKGLLCCGKEWDNYHK